MVFFWYAVSDKGERPGRKTGQDGQSSGRERGLAGVPAKKGGAGSPNRRG